MSSTVDSSVDVEVDEFDELLAAHGADEAVNVPRAMSTSSTGKYGHLTVDHVITTLHIILLNHYVMTQ